MEQPRWLAEAWRELGIRETSGSGSNPRVLALYRDAGHAEIKSDDVAWCAAFLGACLERSGLSSTRSLMARSYLKWGDAIGEGRIGAIAVLSRGADPGAGHVGFVLGETADGLVLLGGNQGDAVSVEKFSKDRVLGFRWPKSEPADDASEVLQSGVFEAALRHVLEMEGGYTDDPYDPGGPTHHGITLSVFAKWRGIDLDGASTAALKAELKRISPDVVKSIYIERYWRPARCAVFPAALALMHFDASVNHGVSGAARLLQQALGVAIDGEIGPETIGRARSGAPLRHVDRYAELRRSRYRALPHFWRFGRGWLRRVDATLSAARAIGGADPADQNISKPTQQTGETSMNGETDGQTKWWGHSVTIWGAIVSALAAVLPVLGPLTGIDISGDLVRIAGEQIAASAQAIIALIGTLMAIFGRLRATERLIRRDVSIRL